MTLKNRSDGDFPPGRQGRGVVEGFPCDRSRWPTPRKFSPLRPIGGTRRPAFRKTCRTGSPCPPASSSDTGNRAGMKEEPETGGRSAALPQTERASVFHGGRSGARNPGRPEPCPYRREEQTSPLPQRIGESGKSDWFQVWGPEWRAGSIRRWNRGKWIKCPGVPGDVRGCRETGSEPEPEPEPEPGFRSYALSYI